MVFDESTVSLRSNQWATHHVCKTREGYAIIRSPQYAYQHHGGGARATIDATARGSAVEAPKVPKKCPKSAQKSAPKSDTASWRSLSVARRVDTAPRAPTVRRRRRRRRRRRASFFLIHSHSSRDRAVRRRAVRRCASARASPRARARGRRLGGRRDDDDDDDDDGDGDGDARPHEATFERG